MDVDLVLVKAEGEYLSQLPQGVRLIDLGAHRTLAACPQFLRYIRKERPDVLLSALTPANLVALIAKMLFRSRLRVVIRQDSTFTEEFENGNLKERGVLRILKWSLPMADCILSVSEGVANDLRRLRPAASRKITTIYNPVVCHDICEKASIAVDHPWFEPEAAPVLISVGRLAAVKDHETLLRAFARVVTARPARLMILGEGPERGNLAALAERLGISQYVEMPGFLPNPFAYMSKSKAFVLSSRFEGLPTVLIEAMACGIPVVSTDCNSGPREILEDGKWGHLVPVGDWSNMAEAIPESLDNPIQSDQLINRASDFSVDASVDLHMKLLTKV